MGKQCRIFCRQICEKDLRGLRESMPSKLHAIHSSLCICISNGFRTPCYWQWSMHYLISAVLPLVCGLQDCKTSLQFGLRLIMFLSITSLLQRTHNVAILCGEHMYQRSLGVWPSGLVCCFVKDLCSRLSVRIPAASKIAIVISCSHFINYYVHFGLQL